VPWEMPLLTVPRFWFCLSRQVVNREFDIDTVLEPRVGLGLQQPVGPICFCGRNPDGCRACSLVYIHTGLCRFASSCRNLRRRRLLSRSAFLGWRLLFGLGLLYAVSKIRLGCLRHNDRDEEARVGHVRTRDPVTKCYKPDH
jgi:hypothetical protein